MMYLIWEDILVNISTTFFRSVNRLVSVASVVNLQHIQTEQAVHLDEVNLILFGEYFVQ